MDTQANKSKVNQNTIDQKAKQVVNHYLESASEFWDEQEIVMFENEDEHDDIQKAINLRIKKLYENKSFILTITKDNLINQIILCKDVEELEDRFADEFLGRELEPCDVSFKDGYFEFEDGCSVCMNTAYPADKKPSGLRNIPEVI